MHSRNVWHVAAEAGDITRKPGRTHVLADEGGAPHRNVPDHRPHAAE